MRIVAGRFKGRTLKAPGDAALRPTSDKVRQAIFNILEHAGFAADFSLDDARIVDLFAGTGALGLEALSRGAKYCLFIEEAAESRAIIRENVEALGLTGASKIWRRDATSLGPLDTLSPFDLAFLDPPYRKGSDRAGAEGPAGGRMAEPERAYRRRSGRGRSDPRGRGFRNPGRSRLWRHADRVPAGHCIGPGSTGVSIKKSGVPVMGAPSRLQYT